MCSGRSGSARFHTNAKPSERNSDDCGMRLDDGVSAGDTARTAASTDAPPVPPVADEDD